MCKIEHLVKMYFKNEYPNQNDIWVSQKWQGVSIWIRYPMGFVGQNGTWPCQKR